jgi:predicted RNase H-like nuclease (RuvC/YqgF family)
MGIETIFSPENVAGTIAFGSAVWGTYNKYKAKQSEKRAKESEDKAVAAEAQADETLASVRAERQMLRNSLEQERKNNIEVHRILDDSQEEREALRAEVKELREEVRQLKEERKQDKAETEKWKNQLKECTESNAAIARQLSSERTKGKGQSRGLPDEGAWKAEGQTSE